MKRCIMITYDEGEDFKPSAEYVAGLINTAIREELKRQGKVASWVSGYGVMDKHNMKWSDWVEK